MKIKNYIITGLLLLFAFIGFGQGHSVAHKWNDLVLEGIRNDYARPTVHARNLFHQAIIAYDCWAAYDDSKQRYFLGETLNGYTCTFNGVSIPANIHDAREEAISYASFRFIINRYGNSPDYAATYALAVDLMNQMGYDINVTSTDYVNGGPAELGNYIAEQIELYGYTDGSNQLNGYSNQYYDQLNPPLEMAQPGNPNIQDPNHWQPLLLETLIDQSGNIITTTQPHLSPEWGDVAPFAIQPSMSNQLTRDGDTYTVYFDTLMPAFLNLGDSSSWDSFYKWNHSLVSIWQSHLDTSDGVMWDISPASIGNNTWYPSDSSEFSLFYDVVNGGDPGTGRALNPITGLPYTPQMVHRADYARVLAEFWADGLDSETPPGHWFEIYHYVTSQPLFEWKWKGQGPVLDKLEYDVKAHLALGGTGHDAAICAWSLKGYYDYIRPVSAIRYMADQGQSSDVNELNYDPNGIPLLAGLIEVVHVGDPLAGQWNENVGKIKVYTWRGHDYIVNPATDDAGVGWILAENWWPYQRPTFVTPPFAGFVSGHSTFSRAAAHTMGFITGSPYFPGGMGEFVAPQNEYLQFEEGPSDTVRLQWATYIDASDQCSLSRIWGGIHPPIDDIPGRKIGDVVGPMVSLYADSLFAITYPALIAVTCSDSLINLSDIGGQVTLDFEFNTPMDTSIAANFVLNTVGLSSAVAISQVDWVDSLNLAVVLDVLPSSIEFLNTELRLQNLFVGNGTPLSDYSFVNQFIVDTRKPQMLASSSNFATVMDTIINQTFELMIVFDEPCDTSISPLIDFSGTNYLNTTLSLNAPLSFWINDSTYQASYSMVDFDEFVDTISILLTSASDQHENVMDNSSTLAPFIIDTENPSIVVISPDDMLITQADLTSPQLQLEIVFSEEMDTTSLPVGHFENQGLSVNSLLFNSNQSYWIDSNTVSLQFLVFADTNNLTSLDFVLDAISDSKGNPLINNLQQSVLMSDMKSPEIISNQANYAIISDSTVGTSNYFIDVTFSETMDTLVTPLIFHTAAQTISSDVQFNLPASQFLDSVTYRAYFQVIDNDVEVAPVDLKIQFGKDYSGNTMVDYISPNFTSIDTKNPSVIDVFANNFIIDQWGQYFEVLAIYDEPMELNTYPTVQFSPLMSVNFPKTDSIWSNGSYHTFTYQLQGNPFQTQLFDLAIDGGIDAAGNIQHPISMDQFFQLSPVLGIQESNVGEAVLYPTIVESGARLNLIGFTEENGPTEFSCVNAMGQEISKIVFYTQGNKLISDRIQLPSGLYYLTNEMIKFKIVVK